MRKIFYYILTIAVALLITVGCGKEFLELELKGVTVFDAKTIDTEKEAYEVLIASYDMLQVKYWHGWGSYYLVGNLPSDDALPVGGGTSDRPEYWELDQFTFTPQNVAFSNLWARNYYGIYRANLVINEIAYQSSLFKAEALYLRAYYYFELARAFGDVVFYTENLDPDAKPGNTDRSLIYEQCVTDLLAAIPTLPLKDDQLPENRFRVSKGAAQALLGKVYLYQGNNEQAAIVLDEIIASGQYALASDYNSIFRPEGEFGSESVFEINYSTYHHGNFWTENGRENEGNIDVQLTGPRETAVGEFEDGWGFDMIDSSLVVLWDSQGDTVRKYGTGFGPEYFKANLTLDPTKDLNLNGFPDDKEKEGWTGWYQKKRATYPEYNGIIEPDVSWGNNERVIRYADVLLMAAEAHNKNGNDSKAIEYVNEVRARANIADLSSTGTQLLEDIKRERRMELGMEGHRFYDLVRWGDAATVLGPLGFEAGKHEVFPIPATEIGLSNLIQNNGY